MHVCGAKVPLPGASPERHHLMIYQNQLDTCGTVLAALKCIIKLCLLSCFLLSNMLFPLSPPPPLPLPHTPLSTQDVRLI